MAGVLHNVFPTRVGVNRATALPVHLLARFPHPRGGEPGYPMHRSPDDHVFPTRVGVNRENLSSAD